MEVVQTKLKDCWVFIPKLIQDDRGYFFESYQAEKFKEATSLSPLFVQDNQSKSVKGVLRGLHFQSGEHAQAKLVSVLQGAVLDVAVDLRKDSPTFGQYHAEVLTAENKHQLFIPRGFAHGFLVLSDTAEFFYKCDNYYHRAADGGVRFDDPSIGIDWGVPMENLILSEKDRNLPYLKDMVI
ncbi:dTDP-4-dehydrorhamnose 3,5-epimerase [Penaeicola halotolerans]|uniref:dTDP-4-dehydrorhamnose 3,5-epimerase n=1 Tax=Penaeicola halotolerans TaxID=2793196 RepID=UPI001CF85A71|nr:dTDP-4-dehydrorhamnose 3,5-epimerase [Penaeicola halotolerans]